MGELGLKHDILNSTINLKPIENLLKKKSKFPTSKELLENSL